MIYTHQRLFLTFDKAEANTPEEALSHAQDLLENDSGFCNGDGSRFGGGVCDWFVIGGRWSGELNKAYMDRKKYHRDIHKIIHPDCIEKGDNFFNKKKNYACWGFSEDELKKQDLILQAKWEAYGGKGKAEYLRGGYEHQPDDAMIVDEKIYDEFLKKYEGSCDDGEWYFADMNYTEVSRENYIGKKWIVVIDFHM